VKPKAAARAALFPSHNKILKIKNMKNITSSEKNQLPVSSEKKKNITATKAGLIKPKLDQDKRRTMDRLMQPLKPLLIELDKSLHNMPLFNEVLNENTQHGFKGRYPAFRIDYSKLILSKGSLPNPTDLTVNSRKPGKLVFRWTNNNGIGESLPSDLLFIAVTNRKSRCWIVSINAEKRSACRYSMDASILQGKPVKVYAGFISEDSERISNSLFLGEVIVF
jgi:hypothetical protein